MSNPKATVTEDHYALNAAKAAVIPAPVLPYRPRDPVAYRPGIGLIGAGGISFAHLAAYRQAGYAVAVICDRNIDKARHRQQEFYPAARITAEPEDVFADPAIGVVDIATHPAGRVALIERAIDAGKHVLSQKPFVLDLDQGAALADRAKRRGVSLAVNQNGRWAPHFAYMREAVKAGIIGEVLSVHTGVHWDHGWIKNTPFEDIDDLVFYDFGIHWFDFLASVIGRTATSVIATRNRAAGQNVRPPMLTQALVTFAGGQASLIFDAGARFGALDHTYIAGTKGSLVSRGPNLGSQAVTLFTAEGEAHPQLTGAWFNDGFHGTMAELLCSIEVNRQPGNSARANLVGLELCLAAIASSHSGLAVAPGSVRKLG